MAICEIKISNYFTWNLHQIEENLCPVESDKKIQFLKKITTYVVQFLKTMFYIALLPITMVIGSFQGLYQKFSKKKILVLDDFEKNPNWSESIKYVPEDIGVSTAEYQVNGQKNHPNCNWAKFENTKFPNNQPHIIDDQKSAKSLDHWNHHDRVIARLNELGVKHYRFSIERSMIEPKENHFSEVNLQHYENFCKKLIENGIEPMITLHHFTDPNWFCDKGSFENETNIDSFVNFSEVVFRRLNSYVTKWVTFNEPSLYSFQGYLRGVFPPGKSNVLAFAKVIKHLLQTHVRVYKKLKKINKDAQIGISHNILRFRAYSKHNPIEKIACYFLNKITHNVAMRFFKTGVFEFKLPFFANVSFREKGNFLDFLGVQYYSDPLLKLSMSKDVMKSTHYPNGSMTNMPYRFYPQGLASALEECRGLNKPIYITETGTDSSPKKRVEFLDKVFKVASKAIENKINLKGVYLWTLEDNFEWDMGWTIKFGLFAFDRKTHQVTIRKSGKYVQDLLKRGHNIRKVS